ncbi:MAG: Nif3-like dinuclear metal center hexameric protein [Prevotella sp.]|nr:Nif3-like dinuclear metal center hexameric protein [Staphylococcus sp.]MCM1349701.1 Nif3-like dinuclear metal center hexameric protein [Prevotella sp.]
MELKKIIETLEKMYPSRLASHFDIGKIGLQFGNKNADIHKMMIALDGTSVVVQEALEEQVDLLLTHHPFLFTPMVSLDYQSVLGQKMYNVFSHQLNIYAMHTNFDVAMMGMNDLLAEKIGLSEIAPIKTEIDESCFMRMGYTEPIDLDRFARRVKDRLGEEAVRVVGNPAKTIQKVGIVGGSGCSEMQQAMQAGCDCFITGEIKHNYAIDAMEHDLALIEVSHSVEALCKVYLKEKLEHLFEGVEIVVSRAEKAPFWWIK